MGFREFSEVTKLAFVDVASRDYGIRGRPTNISRVAVMTGLTRKEVKRVRETLKDSNNTTELKRSPGSQILHYWYHDADFLSPDGKPKSLPFQGEGASFVELVHRYGGDIPPGALRTELKRIGAVREDDNGTLTVLQKTFTPANLDEKLVNSIAISMRALASTVAYNSNPQRQGVGRIERIVVTDRLNKKRLNKFREQAYKQVTKITERLDDWLADFELDYYNADDAPGPQVGIGVFYFEDDPA
jgi:hypothetical protein